MTERFTLLSELGRGGMGVVWKARDEETGQIVALKLLHAAFVVDADYVTRFERELELAKRIHSAHVVEVLGFGARDGVPYLALEYVEGPSLRELLKSHGPYSWPEAKDLLIQITQGLADAHAAGVIHRDLKPSNVLIGPDGVAKLADFGIAKGLDLTRVTGTSTLLGTPAYLAPEGPEDECSDLYSMGVIGYELMVGSPPFEGKTYQAVIIAHLRLPPDLGRLPAAARPIIGRLLAKDPADRPRSARELISILAGEQGAPAGPSAAVQARPPAPLHAADPPILPAHSGYSVNAVALEPDPRSGRPRRRSGLVVGAAIVAVLLIASVAFAGFFLAGASGSGAASVTAGATPTSTATATPSATESTILAEPTSMQYQVKAGDYLLSIAARFNLTLEQLLAANPQLTTNSVPTVGQIINIPLPSPGAPTGSSADPTPSASPTPSPAIATKVTSIRLTTNDLKDYPTYQTQRYVLSVGYSNGGHSAVTIYAKPAKCSASPGPFVFGSGTAKPGVGSTSVVISADSRAWGTAGMITCTAVTFYVSDPSRTDPQFGTKPSWNLKTDWFQGL
jgi:serine/threonine-protein kinase